MPYHVRDVPEIDDQPAAEPVIPMTEIPVSAIGGDTASLDETPKEPTIISDYSVPIPMLPPRKRLKASQCDYSTFSSGDAVGSLAEKSVEAKEKSGDGDLSMLFGSEELSVIQPDMTMGETFGVRAPTVTGASTVASVGSSDVAVATNLNSTAKNSFTSLTVANPAMCQAKLVAAQQEPVQCRRKSRQRTGPATNLQRAVVSRDWEATNGSGGISVVPVPPMVAAPTHNVIHIPEDARVLRTDDGMIIVCQLDGTVQIHGHTEGQPIPLDAIRSLLALDSTRDDPTLFEVSDSKPISQETGQPIPLASLQTEYEMSDQIIGTVVDSQNLVSADGRQYVAIDGSQTLLAYDPNTQSMVQIDPGQGYITLSDDNAFVAVDGTQSVLSIDGGYQAEQAVVPNTALIHLLPSDHMQ